MPKRNERKLYAPDNYYHIYSRSIFSQLFDPETTSIFLNIIKSLLTNELLLDNRGRKYTNHSNRLELLAFAIMPNHFHLLIYQSDENAMTEFMHSLLLRFSMNYNKIHSRRGPLFESRYLAKLITTTPQLLHTSRYIHLNPLNWQSGKNTSLNYYSGRLQADWLNPNKILTHFPSYPAYLQFLKDYDPLKDQDESVEF